MTKTYSETINVKRIVLLKALNCSSSGMPKYRIIAEVDDGSFIELETATNSIIAYLPGSNTNTLHKTLTHHQLAKWLRVYLLL